MTRFERGLPKGELAMKRVVFFMVTLTALMVLAGTTTLAASTIDINTENAEEGYISVKFNTGSDKKIKLLVASGDTKYYYNLTNSDTYVNFPLQFGNGIYTVAIYENTAGTKYRKLVSKRFNVTIPDQKTVYLNSIQEIEFHDKDDAAVLKAEVLKAEGTKAKRARTGDEAAELTDKELVELYYNFVVETIVYDYEKIENLEYNYLPDNNLTVATESGICYDYSSLLASMLRSQDIPTKMIKGYTSWTDVYHAWNEIYLADEDRWVIVDTTYDAYLYIRDRSYVFEKSKKVYTTSKFY